MPRIKRDAFLYLEGKRADFAQCSSCCFFEKTRGDDGNCHIFKKEVDGDDTCGMYVPGPFSGISNAARVTPAEAGFLKDTEVRCENCRYGGDECRLYVMLNRRMPKTFELETKIKPKACCNAWRKK